MIGMSISVAYHSYFDTFTMGISAASSTLLFKGAFAYVYVTKTSLCKDPFVGKKKTSNDITAR